LISEKNVGLLIKMKRVEVSNKIINQYKLRTGVKTFIGGNPATLEQKDVYNIWNKMYNITPKVDGVRYLCIMDSTDGNLKNKTLKTPYFIDRGGVQNYIRVFQPQHTNGSTPLPRAFPSCILDGELVKEKVKGQKRTRQIYWIFDILSLNGRLITHLSFNQRQTIIEDEIKKWCSIDKNPETWFFMMPKPYYNPSEFASARDPYVNIGNKFTEYCAKLNFSKPVLDGLIINDTIRPYVSGVWKRCDNVQYKWKPQDQQTIDVTLTKDDMPGSRKNEPLSFKLTHPKNKKEYVFTFEKPEGLPNMKDRPRNKRTTVKGGGFKEEPLVAELLITDISRKTKKISTKFERFRDDKQANAYRTMTSVINGYMYPIELKKLFSREPEKVLQYFTKRQLLRIKHFRDVFNSQTTKGINSLCKPSSSKSKIVIKFPGKNNMFDCVKERGFPVAVIRELSGKDGEFVLLAGDKLRVPKYSGKKLTWAPVNKSRNLDIDTDYLYHTSVNIVPMALVNKANSPLSRRGIVEKTIFRVTGYTNIIFEKYEKDSNMSFYLETFPGENSTELIRIIRMILHL